MLKILIFSAAMCTQRIFLFIGILLSGFSLFSQNLPGDQLVFGPMLSPVYDDSVRVWIMTKASSGSGDAYSLEVMPLNGTVPLLGQAYDSDDRSGYYLRSYLYTNLTPGQSYNVSIKKNGIIVNERSTTFSNDNKQLSDFEFLAGGCGRIFDLSRCIDQVEARSHINGTPEIYNHMATEDSDLMVWLGDAVYLLGLQHANGECPEAIDDWANKDACFDRYVFYRNFHDSLCRAMPQLAITDNHDTGPNEFNKDMPTLGITKELFTEWWPNPHYNSNSQGQGLYSSYKYKDVEFFLLDNRSYRESTVKHLGVEQLAWLKQSMLNSSATFKVIISGTPTFDKRGGGRNFSITAECDELIQFIKANNINGVLSYSADIHRQEFYGRYNDHSYPFFDVLSGNLASDIGTGNPVISPDNDMIFDAVVQTYTRNNIYGEEGNRRLKIDYVSPEGIIYYGTIIHEDMLKSTDESTLKFSLSFSNGLKDSSDFDRVFTSTQVAFDSDRKNTENAALQCNINSSLTLPYSSELDMQDRTFSITYWIKPTVLPVQNYGSVFSNGQTDKGFTIGIDKSGSPIYVDHAKNKMYTGFFKLKTGNWTHVVWKYDNVKLQLVLYINGQLLQKWSNVASPISSNVPLSLGNNFNNNVFMGSIDEINLFGKLISDQYILDVSEYKSHRGQALSLPGSQNTVIPSAEYNTLLSNSFTLETWARVTSTPANGSKLLSCNGRVSNNTTGFVFEFSSSGKLTLTFGNNSSGWTSIAEKGNVWRVGEWNHIAVTLVNNDSIYYYTNGVKIGSAKFNHYIPNNFGLAFGKSVVYGGALQAEFDEFRIWNTPQSQDSIVKRMHYELDGTEMNLALYYDFTAFTENSVKSKGINTYELSLASSPLIPSSAPISKLLPMYRSIVGGNWSVKKENTSGLLLNDAITSFNSNLIAGRDTDTTTLTIPNEDHLYYLKGGWQINTLNLPIGTLQLDFLKAYSKADSIIAIASEYYLIKETETALFNKINTGYFDGRSLRFINSYLDSGVYHLAWKVDPNARLYSRKGAISLNGTHNALIPFNKVNTVLNNDFTIECWTRIMEEPNGSLISNHGRVNENSTGLTLEFQGNRTLQATIGTNDGGWNKINCKQNLNIGEWNHVAVTASPGGWFKFYLNGEPVDSSSFDMYYANQINMGIGSSPNYNNQTISTIDELRIWKKVKTKKEIQDMMFLSIKSSDNDLVFNYTFDHHDYGYIVNTGTLKDSVRVFQTQLITSTAPIGDIEADQQYKITGSWSVKDSSNAGLSVMVTIPDYETNLVMGKNQLKGHVEIPQHPDQTALQTLWQIDPLKIAEGTFVFEGELLLEEQWSNVKTNALEYYLLKQDNNGELKVQAVGELEEDNIVFSTINLDYGIYTLGWKNSTTGLIDKNKKELHFYPNPSNNYLKLTGFDNAVINKIYVHNMNGLIIQTPYTKTENEIVLNTSSLPSGMYVIILTGNNTEKQALRFIKQ